MKTVALRSFVFHAPHKRFFPSLAGLIAAAMLALVVTPPAQADVTGEGDVTPQGPTDLPIDGGTVVGGVGQPSIVVVGGTGVPNSDNTTVGRLTIDVPAFTLPLVSDAGVIGFQPDGVGIAIVAGFFSEWRMNETLSVGVDGQGFLEITGGAIVRTDFPETGTADFDAYIGGNDDVANLSETGGGQGFVTINGFGSQLRNSNLAVGFRGYGQIDISGRGLLLTRESATIGVDVNAGDDAVGTGFVSVDGIGSRWLIGELGPTATSDDGSLIVGNEGRGTLVVRNGGLVQVEVDTTLGVVAGSYGSVTVTGQNSSLVTLRNLVVGNATNTAIGELHLDNQATARVDGTTTIGGQGLLELNGGSIQSAGTLTNNGVLRGDGRIESALVVNNSDIRNAAGVANIRERLLFTGAVTNNDIIESIGGEIEFQGAVTNTTAQSDIVGIDAIFRFYGGVNNTGNFYFDNTLIYTLEAPIQSNANVSVIGGDPTTLIGGINFGTSNIFSVEVGNAPSRLDASKIVTLGGDIEIALEVGYVPVAGDTFEVLSGEAIAGTFDSVFSPDTVAGGFVGGWVLDYDADSVFAIFDANASNTTPGDGDGDGDGDVDGNDFLVWQRGPALDPNVLQDIKDNFGSGTAIVAAGAVPEPSAWALAMLATIGGYAARRRKSVR